MSALILIMYVGNKPSAHDNVAKSGKVWNGKGDVQEVTAEQARILLKYPDQWDVVEPEDAGIVHTEVVTQVTNEDGETVDVSNSDLNKAIEKMSKPELLAYAMAKFGKELDATKPKKLLIDSIEEFERDLEPIAAVDSVK